jgi:hypothetical protein
MCYKPGMVTVIVIGERGNLSRGVARRHAKLAAKAIKQMPPHEAVDPAIFGYDTDPRELWDIPKARDYFIAFIDATIAEGIPADRWLPQTHALLAACRAAQAGQQVHVEGTVADTVLEGVEQILDYTRTHLH